MNQDSIKPVTDQIPRASWKHGTLCIALVAALGLSMPGCISKNASQGVANLWRGPATPVFEQGKSTQDDVLKALGPPSQVINLGKQTVFYYLLEQRQSQSLVLIVYNQTQTNIIYDRAIFFFDADGRLKEFATSDEKIMQPTKEKE